mmetsp:Transcript_3220/g.9821  ORF Transcript_3220/g.9821 Transcript_3220/m.9821 type:complete len:202 (-) Transcript_3220:368-973(-)|eukprot:CAMPEP_0198722748 /NCGR_PEP_ID=MMETSP1475-20131203/373_1 /TAXON_ID= ORGANISM="Unidentified sp., Strain CCMP1999" /NCGR_SAMPLE_ID=MMETSP1475 /ASSEMBLY_ACC=CAM_ASM_001111 /LENGTH=201 /DNA_ID=CAMNT_0044483667 /DNA_START=170 /DNA_END=775 /DNA_ORIENTATION=-
MRGDLQLTHSSRASAVPLAMVGKVSTRDRRQRIQGCPQTYAAFLSWTPKVAFADPAGEGIVPEGKRTATQKAITVATLTASSFLNGLIFGGLFGLVSGAWSTKSWAGAWANAKTSGMSWGGLSATYSGLQSLATAIRDKQDKYNNIIGACGSGALLSLPSGPQAALRGCASFSLFAYFFDAFFSGSQTPERTMEEKLISGE